MKTIRLVFIAVIKLVTYNVTSSSIKRELVTIRALLAFFVFIQVLVFSAFTAVNSINFNELIRTTLFILKAFVAVDGEVSVVLTDAPQTVALNHIQKRKFWAPFAPITQDLSITLINILNRNTLPQFIIIHVPWRTLRIFLQQS